MAAALRAAMAHLQLPLKSVNVWATRLTPDGRIPLPEIQEQRSSRATRVIDDPRQLLFVHVPRAPVDKEAVDRAVRVLVTKGLKWDDNSYVASCVGLRSGVRELIRAVLLFVCLGTASWDIRKIT